MLILSGCSDHKSGQPASTGKPAAKALPVKIASVVLKDMPVELRAVGSAEAFARVEIRSQVSGLLEKVAFKEGDLIKQGDLLFRIDPRPFASRLEQAAATLAKDRVDLENARKQAKRYLPAAEKGYVSIEQSDAAQTSAASLEATLIADEAALKNARIELDNCTILSPLSGYSGELFVDPGTLIKANDQILVTINQVSPIKVSFTLPEQALPEIKKHLMANDMTVIVDSAGSPLTGKLNFVDNQVNQTTGTIRLKAIFNNDDHQLWPGEFINVRLRLTTMKDASVVPTRAIQASQTGDFVYVVKNDQTVEQRPVSVGFSVEDQTVINSGLEPGETVVTDGQLRLRAGALVQALDEPATNVPAKAAP
jgi:multidrug efflux system membrane fusion protein